MLLSRSGSLWAASIDVLMPPHGNVLCRDNKAGVRVSSLLKLDPLVSNRRILEPGIVERTGQRAIGLR